MLCHRLPISASTARRLNQKFRASTSSSSSFSTTTKPSTPNNNPKPKKSSASIAAVGILALAGGSFGFYVWNNNRIKEEELRERQQVYASSGIRRLKLASYLVSPANRALLTDYVNRLVNVPGIGERVEGVLIRKGVDQCMEALERILVSDIHVDVEINIADDNDIPQDKASLQADLEDTAAFEDLSQDDIESVKEALVEKINAKVDLYGLNEKQEAVLIRGLVHQLFTLYPGILKLL